VAIVEPVGEVLVDPTQQAWPIDRAAARSRRWPVAGGHAVEQHRAADSDTARLRRQITQQVTHRGLVGAHLPGQRQQTLEVPRVAGGHHEQRAARRMLGAPGPGDHHRVAGATRAVLASSSSSTLALERPDHLQLGMRQTTRGAVDLVQGDRGGGGRQSGSLKYEPNVNL
jgi:hypothetical protein